MAETHSKPATALHLRLTKEQWLKDFKALTRAQLGVLYYIETSDPFGDRGVLVTITEMAAELGLDKSSVSRALKQLDQMGYIDSEVIKARVKVLHPRNNVASTQQALHPRNLRCVDATSVASTQQALHPRNKRCTHATNVAPTQQTLHPRNKLAPEPLSHKGSTTPQTLNTLKTKNTLSDTRENDLKDEEKEKPWVNRNFSPAYQKVLASLPDPKAFLDWAYEHCGDGMSQYPTYPSSVIEKNHYDLWQRFSKTQGEAKAPTQDWANHPKRDEWIDEIRKGRPRFVALGGPPEECDTRQQFAAWAEANNLVWEKHL